MMLSATATHWHAQACRWREGSKPIGQLFHARSATGLRKSGVIRLSIRFASYSGHVGVSRNVARGAYFACRCE